MNTTIRSLCNFYPIYVISIMTSCLIQNKSVQQSGKPPRCDLGRNRSPPLIFVQALKIFSHSDQKSHVSRSILQKMSDQDTGNLPPVSHDVSDRSRATQIRKEIKIVSSRPPKTSAAAKRYNHWQIIH